MIESMATGTPVIGMNLGSVDEVIDQGKTVLFAKAMEKWLK